MNGHLPDDNEFGAFLQRHDSVVPPSAETLAHLELRILAQAAALPRLGPRSSIPADTGWWLPGMTGQPWALRSAGLLAVLVLVFGFVAGHGLSATSTTETTTTFAKTTGTPWQSFITTASLDDTQDATGDSTDDTADDGNDDSTQ